MTDGSAARGRWRGRLVALTLSTLTALAGGELFCRLRVQRLNQETLSASLSRPVTLSSEGQATLGDLIQLSENDRIAYELRPGLPGVIFKDRPVTTNSRGFRSPEVPHRAQDGEVTILGIGDSVLFGHGVADGECYLDQLQRLLSERRPERRWRIVNTGVPGYNTVMEVETLVTKGLAFAPDLVLVGVVGNDYEPPVYVRDGEDPWELSRSFLLEFVRDGLTGEDQASYLRRASLTHRGTWSDAEAESDATAAPPRYSALYGPEAFGRAVDQLADLQVEHGFELLNLCTITYDTPPYDFNEAKGMLAAMAGQGLPVLDLQFILDEALEAQTGRPFNIPDYKVSDLVVNPNNLHPSVLAHGMIAEALFDELESSGVLDRLCD